MTKPELKAHWEHVYENKAINEVSWYQSIPETSLLFFTELNIPKDAKIIDVGGGDSFLVDHLLTAGYSNITVLDISSKAIERAQIRLKENAKKIKWIVGNITECELTEQYDYWHDRAVFHFLTEKSEVEYYVNLCNKNISLTGHIAISTFSEDGPLKCSGLNIQQYSPKSLTEIFSDKFQKLSCFLSDHPTPFGTTQNFTHCIFRRK